MNRCIAQQAQRAKDLCPKADIEEGCIHQESPGPLKMLCLDLTSLLLWIEMKNRLRGVCIA